ncbi:MAG: hypothetical protein J6R91_00215 [Bacteroidaceae bacterium]|nr:hypothetical protein [Bacteroidaceae bacterium]
MGSQREQKLFDYSHQTVSNYSLWLIKPSQILEKEKTPKALKQGIASRMGSQREQKFSNSLILEKEKKAKPLKQGNFKPHGSCTLFSVL